MFKTITNSLTSMACIVLASGAFAVAEEAESPPEEASFPADYQSPPSPPPEGREIRRYAVDDPGTGATNFGMAPVHDNMRFHAFRADRFEYRDADEGDVYLWDVQGWIGRDYNKLFVESEGEWSETEDTLESAQVEMLYGRAISSFWDFRAGIRYDFEPDPERAFAVAGIQGLAQQWFEVEANVYLDEEGNLSVGMEVEYDILLSQRLVLQPRLETEISFHDVPQYGIGTGFTAMELGVRLRYEFSRKFAPYIGIGWEAALGETRDIVQSGGGDPEKTVFIAGVRFWY